MIKKQWETFRAYGHDGLIDTLTIIEKNGWTVFSIMISEKDEQHWTIVAFRENQSLLK